MKGLKLITVLLVVLVVGSVVVLGDASQAALEAKVSDYASSVLKEEFGEPGDDGIYDGHWSILHPLRTPLEYKASYDGNQILWKLQGGQSEWALLSSTQTLPSNHPGVKEIGKLNEQLETLKKKTSSGQTTASGTAATGSQEGGAAGQSKVSRAEVQGEQKKEGTNTFEVKLPDGKTTKITAANQEEAEKKAVLAILEKSEDFNNKATEAEKNKIVAEFMKQIKAAQPGQPSAEKKVEAPSIIIMEAAWNSVYYNGQFLTNLKNEEIQHFKNAKLAGASSNVLDAYMNLRKDGNKPTIDNQGSLSYLKHTETKSGITVTETVSYDKDMKFNEAVISQSGGGYTILTYKDIDGKVTDTQIKIDNKLVSLGAYTRIILKKDKDSDTIMPTYNGRPIEVKQGTGETRFEFKDEKGGFVQFLGGDLTVEQDEAGNTEWKKKGKEYFKLEYEDSIRFLSTKEDEQLPAAYLKNLPTMLKVAELNRIDRDELNVHRSEEGAGLITASGKEEITLYTDNSIDYIYYKYNEKDTVKMAIYQDGNLKVTRFEEGGSAMQILWNLDTANPNERNFLIVDGIEGLKNSRYVRYRDPKQKNIDLYCLGGKPESGCINLNDGKTWYKKGDEWKECEEKDLCGKLEKEIKGNLDLKSTATGGPTRGERRIVAFFDILEASQTGFGKLYSLFMSDEELADWRNRVDQAFCDLYLGEDCWISEICDDFNDKVYEATLFMEASGGVPDAVAHIEAERQDLFHMEESDVLGEYLYKISFGVKNPDGSKREMRFNLRAEGQRTEYWFDEDQIVAEGTTLSKAGKDMIVEYRNETYDTICIEFRQPIQRVGGESVSEICNRIVPVIGEYYNPYKLIPGRDQD